MSTRVRPDPVGLHRVLSSPDGDLARDVQRRARNVQLKAKDLVGKRTHELERNILTRTEVSGRGVLGRVIAGEQLPDARAVWNHDGTKPHIIRPKKPGGMLSFVVNGKRVFARKVQHPGTAATKFLLRAGDEARR